jgi:hypothetical protein
MTMMKRLLISMLVSLVVVVYVAAGTQQRQETFLIYYDGVSDRVAVKDAIITVCWDGICQTKFTTNIGHAKFFVPLEVNSVFVDVLPADPDMCSFAGTVTLAGMKEYQVIWVSDCTNWQPS